MNWFTNLFTGKIPLTQTERKVVWKLFGSFHANKLGQNNNAYLTEGYESNVDVYSVVSKTYEVFNSIPQIVERKTSEGWELEEDTPSTNSGKSLILESVIPGTTSTRKGWFICFVMEIATW